MKCLYIGDFTKSFSSEVYIAYALEKNGVEVYKMEELKVSDFAPVRNVIMTFRPDFVLLCKNRVAMNGNHMIKCIRDLGVPVITWVFDLYFDLPLHRRSRSGFESNFDADIVVTTDGGHDAQWAARGTKHKLVRQGIHEPEAHYGVKGDAPEIVFIGSVIYSDRIKLLNFLENTYGDRFKHYGMGGKAKVIRGEDLNNLLASTKIVVGDSQPSKNYWSNRLYEITGRGGFLLHPKVEGLEKEFSYYKEIVPYDRDNHEQLKEIIDFYLTHDKEREAIRKAGHERTKRDYTYTIRVAEFLKVIKQ